MALITCPECTGTVSDKAYLCPHCGYPIAGTAAAREEAIHALSQVATGANVVPPSSEGFYLFSADKDFVNVECKKCEKIYKYKRLMYFSEVAPEGCVPNTPIQCPNCGNITPANSRILPKENSAHISNTSASHAPQKKKKDSDTVSCPKCGSTQIQMTKKGFGLGKAAVGGLLLGPVGLLGGAIGANNVQRVCVKCRYKF